LRKRGCPLPLAGPDAAETRCDSTLGVSAWHEDFSNPIASLRGDLSTYFFVIMNHESKKYFDDAVDQRRPAATQPSTASYAVSHSGDRQPVTRTATMLRRAQVEKILNLSRSAIYARMDRNSDVFDATFPARVRYGNTKAVFWIAEEVSAWLDEQVRRTRSSSSDAHSQKSGGAA